MSPFPLRTLLFLALFVPASAGQIEAPVNARSVPGAPSGSLGAASGAPVPIQMIVPSLTAASAPGLAPVLAAAPIPVQPAAVQPARPAAAPVPVLPGSAVAPVRPRAIARARLSAAAASDASGPGAGIGVGAGLDAGRILFDRGPGKVLDPELLPKGVYSPEIMSAAREAGLVFELTPAALGRMKPGVEHNYVIVRNPDGTIAMTVGRLAAADVKETGVKHVALGEGRAVLFSGGARVDPVTGRPALDFNSGMYSQVGLDARWDPTPENARSLAAHAQAILGVPVDVVDHFEKRPVAFRSPRSVVRRGASRADGWEVDGLPARRLSGGGFKEVLIHPADSSLVLKLFSELGAKDAAGSLAEKRLELRNLGPLLRIGRAPRVVSDGALELQAPSRGKRTAGYILQERVEGRELGDLLRDRDPAVRSGALKEVRALFDDLVAARIKLEDRVKMGENISIGRAGAGEAAKAWVLDAGEATLAAPRGRLDKLLGRPDPLRAYYDAVLADLTASRR
ncbi:MAG: hypothetical protein NUW21_10615 [Elusimicrobia bacterium]|nr:hypothetical protein [Elusimicrobiota bacterium]